jgi:hypothetical protein
MVDSSLLANRDMGRNDLGCALGPQQVAARLADLDGPDGSPR